MKTNRASIILAGVLALGLAAVAPPAAALPAEAPPGDAGHQGWIYGTVETDSGNTYTGVLRWGTEEAFWDDLFNSSKEDLPYLDRQPRAERRRDRIKVFGFTIGYRWEDSSSGRVFIARFGDIREIVPRRGDRADIVMKGGTTFSVDGGSNDVGAKITVQDESLGDVQLDWDKIERITFSATPAGVQPRETRLYGELVTEHATFEGFIQWDSQECISSDKLDGDSEDGDVSIDMGKIRAIEKRNRNGSWVELKDGRRLHLEDSNDVDSDIRGIFVEDPKIGRVKVSWDAFERVEFRDPGSTGRGYDDYPPARRLTGTVTDYDDRTYEGELAFDLDETESFEMLNGDRDDVEYYIPFDMIRSIEPSRDDTSVVKLRNGTRIELEDGQDVSERNDGVLVLRDNGREVYIPWRDLKRVDFD